MPDTFTNLTCHFVFSTKNRLPLLTREVRPKLFPYIAGIVNKKGGEAMAVGGMPDHVHVVVRMSPSVSAAGVMRAVKANSSKWMNQHQTNSRFGWQAGYGAFSVSQSLVPVVVEYVKNQASHHRHRSYSDEIATLIERHGVVSVAPPGLDP